MRLLLSIGLTSNKIVYTTPAPKGPLASSIVRTSPSVSRTTDTSNGDTNAKAVYTSPTIRPVQPSLEVSPSAPQPLATSPVKAEPTATSLDQKIVNATNITSPTPGTRTTALNFTKDNSHNSPVMNETLSQIDEHITDMQTPRHSLAVADRRANDSASEYSAPLDRLSYIAGTETDEEEQSRYTAAEVARWTPERVAEYLEDVGVEKRHCEVFKEQEVSGEVLLEMDQEAIFLKEFDLGPVGRRLKTWHKIKALHQEVYGPKASGSVSSYTPVEEPADSRTRSTSTTVLPRIPSLNQGSTTRTGSLTQRSIHHISQQSATYTPDPTSAPFSATEFAPRPSAAQVRDLGHARRHSSIDHAPASGPQTPTSPVAMKSATLASASHKKLPSFDRDWTMGSSGHERSSTMSSLQHPINGRPLSSSGHTHTLSTDGTKFDSSAHELGMMVVSPEELDRGYFSGGEVENRKTSRNILRKHYPPYENGSYSPEARRRSGGGFLHLRAGSTDSTRDVVAPISSAAKNYYSQSKKGSRAMSGPDLLNGRQMRSANDVTPTVTKLGYGDSHSIDAIANSPKFGNDDRVSPATAFLKSRGLGLRAMSDNVTGSEKARASSPGGQSPKPPPKDSPIVSPTRTGSTTPSGTSLDDSSLNKSTTLSSGGGMTPAAVVPRRAKNKKTTSAYTRGLEKKTPQEQMIGCDYSGWMKKKSSQLMTTWKPRLFVLRGRRLSYYYSDNDTEEKGLIDISSHRVLPADTERLQGLHATLTGATASPTSPQNSTTPTTASTDLALAEANGKAVENSGIFIFKLVPPRTGLSKAVNFTKPTVHYFAVDSIQEGRLWMAALMKATIDRDEGMKVVTTYNQKTISLTKARAMRQRPPALRDLEEEEAKKETDSGLGLTAMPEKTSKESERESQHEESSFFTTNSNPDSANRTSTIGESEAGTAAT